MSLHIFSDFWLKAFTIYCLFFILIPSYSQEKTIKSEVSSLIRTSDNLNDALSNAKLHNKKVVLIFGSPSCRHCHEFKKEVYKIDSKKVSSEFIFVLVDVDRNYQKAKKYNVKGTPHVFILNKLGDPIKDQLGKQSSDEFISFLKLNSEDQESNMKNNFGHLPWSPKGYRRDSICFSNVGYGPLKLSTQSPFQSLRITYQPQTPSTLIKGQWEFHVQNVWANIWAQSEGDYFLDFETLSNQFNFSYGFSDTMQVEFQFDQRSRFGGVMDGFIQGFHDTFGLGQDGRKDVSKENFDITIEDQNGSEDLQLKNRDRGIYTQNLHFIFQHNVTCGSYYLPAFSYSIAIRRDLWSKDEFEEKFPVDISFSTSVSRRMGNTYAYLSAGYTFYGQGFLKNNQGLELKNSQLSILLAGEWKLSNNVSLVLQYLFTEGAVKNRSPFSKASNEITFGLNWEFSNKKLLQIGMIENILEFDNSADFGIYSSITIRM